MSTEQDLLDARRSELTARYGPAGRVWLKQVSLNSHGVWEWRVRRDTGWKIDGEFEPFPASMWAHDDDWEYRGNAPTESLAHEAALRVMLDGAAIRSEVYTAAEVAAMKQGEQF